MHGGTLARRALLAAALVGGSIVSIVVGLAGAAQANDHSTQTACIDKTTGAWRASITFASIDVHDGHPVVVSFGSASTTLTEPGPNGTATLHQDFTAKDQVEQVSWSIVRNGAAERSGSAVFSKPDGCVATPATVPTTAAPATPTTPPAPPTTAPAPPTTTHQPAAPATRPAEHARSTSAPLPVTGGHPSPLLWMGMLALGTGAAITWLSRRRPDELSGTTSHRQ